LRRTQCLYLIFEELDFTFDEQRLGDFRDCWNNGRTVGEMAKYFRRPAIEIYLLVLEQLMLGQIDRGSKPKEWLKTFCRANYTGKEVPDSQEAVQLDVREQRKQGKTVRRSNLRR
jgi:hypothetical protein